MGYKYEKSLKNFELMDLPWKFCDYGKRRGKCHQSLRVVEIVELPEFYYNFFFQSFGFQRYALYLALF